MKKLTAVLLSVFLLAHTVSAEAESGTPETASEAVTDVAAETEPVGDGESGMSDGKIFGGLLMVGSLISAACISTLIFKGRDKTKYL